MAKSGLRAKCRAFPPAAIATDGGKRRHVNDKQPRDIPANQLYKSASIAQQLGIIANKNASQLS